MISSIFDPFRWNPFLAASVAGPRKRLRGLAVTLAGSGLSLLVVAALIYLLPRVSSVFEAAIDGELTDMQVGNWPALALLLLMFAPWAAAFVVVWRVLGGAPSRQIFTWTAGFHPADLTKTFAAGLLSAILLWSALALAYPGQFTINPDWRFDPAWIAVAVLVILIQAGSEEVVFRGFLPRALGPLIPVPALLAGLITIFFIALHLSNQDVQRDPVFNVFWFVVSEALAWYTLFRTKSLAAPIGLHASNNIFAFLAMTVNPGGTSKSAFVTFNDPVLLAGGSRLADPLLQGAALTGTLLMLLALFHPRSPFYLPARDAVAVEHTASAGEPGGQAPPSPL